MYCKKVYQVSTCSESVLKRFHFPKSGINLLGMVVMDKVYRYYEMFDHYTYALTHQPSRKCIKTFSHCSYSLF